MANKPTFNEVFDVNKKTGALILGKDRLDDYATKYLVQHCKKALETPMPLPVDEILANEGLTVKEALLSANHDIFGCCMLLDGYAYVFDPETREKSPQFFKSGTVLIDPESEAIYGEGSKRNTLIHEALHWEKDKKYFEILSVKNAEVMEELCPIMCRQSETFYVPPEGKKTKANEVRQLEWQAHRLAPRVLMPKEPFRVKALELIDEIRQYGNEYDFPCDALIEKLSDFFVVSRVSVKIRLQEVELLQDISAFSDYEDVFAEINNRRTFAKITPIEAYRLMLENQGLQEWVSDGHFVFVDGYFVLADEKNIQYRNGVLCLTNKAKKNLSRCVLNIIEQKNTTYGNIIKDWQGYSCLAKYSGVDERILAFHPKFQTDLNINVEDAYKAFDNKLNAYDEEEEIELVKMLADPKITLCQCLWFLMKNRKWTYPETFNEKTQLHKNYHGKIKNDKYNNMGKDVLMAICVGLGLNVRLTEKIFEKSQAKLDRYQEPDKTYLRIMEFSPGLSLSDFNYLFNVIQLSTPDPFGQFQEGHF